MELGWHEIVSPPGLGLESNGSRGFGVSAPLGAILLQILARYRHLYLVFRVRDQAIGCHGLVVGLEYLRLLLGREHISRNEHFFTSEGLLASELDAYVAYIYIYRNIEILCLYSIKKR